jgi:hypothetical protein
MENNIYSGDFQLEMETADPAAGPEGREGTEEAREAEAAEPRGCLRLRKPERRQMAWVAQCADDLVPAEHPVRRIAAVVEHQERLRQAIAQLPEVKKRHEATAQRAGRGRQGKKIRTREPRVSTTDAEARVMKMSNGGFNPAVNVQLAADTASRALVGVEVSNEGSDAAGLSAPLREPARPSTPTCGPIGGWGLV